MGQNRVQIFKYLIDYKRHYTDIRCTWELKQYSGNAIGNEWIIWYLHQLDKLIYS